MSHVVAKSFTFAASHQLDGLGPDHQCTRLHGHNYEAVIELTGPLDDNGMVFDYGRLRLFADFLAATVDHRHLNDVVPFNPTAELLACWFHDEATRLLDLPAGVTITAVVVSETVRSSAEYRP